MVYHKQPSPAIRPGQFLILNDDQRYSCHIDHEAPMRTLSVFFKKEFASSVFRNALNNDETLLDNPIAGGEKTLEFFQTLQPLDPGMQQQLFALVTSLEMDGYDRFAVDEHLVFLLHHLIKLYQSDARHTKKVNAVKSSTQAEVYKRLCVAKDLLHSYYMDKPDLNAISTSACLSIPQLIRQFKSVFNSTPHQYLIKIRLQKAVELLKQTSAPVNEVSWKCGFENVSAFCRAFKSAYGVQPGSFRK